MPYTFIQETFTKCPLRARRSAGRGERKMDRSASLLKAVESVVRGRTGNQDSVGRAVGGRTKEGLPNPCGP